MVLVSGSSYTKKTNGSYTMEPKFRDVTDGLSNTLMVGESSNKISYHTGHWGFFNHTTATCAIPLNYKQSNGNLWSVGDWPHNYSFHSYHVGGAQFCLGDGRVRFISDNISTNIYRALATREGNEVLGQF